MVLTGRLFTGMARSASCHFNLSMSEILFEIKEANVFIPGKREREPILKNISWNLARGEHYAILGANGAGKSSLLKLIHGDLWPCSGSICWYDKDGKRQESRIAARELTAIVSPELQERCLCSVWPQSVKDFLFPQDASYNLQASKAAEKTGEEIEGILSSKMLADLLDTPLNRLSQGQLRLTLLLRAIQARPRILLLDEYTDGLDIKNRVLALDLLQKLRDKTSIIFTSHKPDMLPEWCAGRLFLHKGRQVGHYPVASRAKEASAVISSPSSSQALFTLSNVTVYIDRHKILKKINWQCMQGEHWRIGGDNGSGKSTFLRLLAGDEFAAAGGDIKRWNPAKGRWANSLSETRSQYMLVSDLSQILNDYPLCALELLCTGFDNTTGLYREIKEEERERALAILEEFFPDENLSALAQRDMRRFSTGQLRKLYLARAMLHEPAALLLDEPLNGLDSESREQYLSSLRKLAARGTDGPAIIMVSHYDDDMPAFIRRQARLEHGELKIIS